METGLAREIADKYPEVEESDAAFAQSPGKNLYIPTWDNRMCVNMYTDSDIRSFEKCLDELRRVVKCMSRDVKIAFPYMVGCISTRDNWCNRLGMLIDFARDIKQDVYILDDSRITPVPAV